MKVVVTGLSLISGLGTTLETWRKLLSGHTSIHRHQPFAAIDSWPLALVGQQPSDLKQLTRQAVARALQDANLALPLPECGVVIGSSRGYQAKWESLAHQYWQSPSPVLSWLDTFPNTAATTAAREIRTAGPVLAPMAACATGLWAIAQGFELLQAGQCQRVIVGAVEAPVTPLTLVGFKQLGALARTGAYPFDCRREGLVLGEGAAVLVMEALESARQRGAKIYGQVLGFGLTADAYHVSAPEPKRQAAIAAVQHCLKHSGLSANSVGYIHAHGTGTRLNDEAEAHLLQSLFPAGVPVSSTKGATGHTLGASGAIGAALCLMALQHQVLPPCVGLQQPAFDLDLIATSRPCPTDTALCFSFGFGGQNAVLAVASMD